jgi:NTE family protein
VNTELLIDLQPAGRFRALFILSVCIVPNTLNQEVKDLEAGGTKTKLIVVGLPPGLSKVENLLDPKWIAPYLKFGYDRGIADIAMMKGFWS